MPAFQSSKLKWDLRWTRVREHLNVNVSSSCDRRDIILDSVPVKHALLYASLFIYILYHMLYVLQEVREAEGIRKKHERYA